MSPEALRTWRESRNLTQKALAEIAGVSVRQVRRWETGDSPVPRLLIWFIEANPA